MSKDDDAIKLFEEFIVQPEEVQDRPTPLISRLECKCSVHVLIQHGCSCGAFFAEQLLQRNSNFGKE